MKTKGKSKPKTKVAKKQLPVSGLDVSAVKVENSQKISKPVSYKKKYWILGLVIIILVCLGWFLSQTWLVRSSLSQSVTYPNASVFGINVGGFDVNQLDKKLAEIKTEFESKKVTLVNDKNKWDFDSNKLGVTFDAKATGQSVLQLNNFNFMDKYRLITGGISSAVVPTVLVNNDQCVKALSVIPVVQIAPKDASFYYDKGLKIKPDQSGTKFNAALTCKELSKQLAANVFVANVSLDITKANITKTDLDPKSSQIQSMVGESLTLKSGNYQQVYTPEQLFALLEIVKVGSEVKVNWSSAKLDEIVNGIADKVNTYNSAPALGACQYVSSVGGNWLNKSATKQIFTDLGAGKARAYDLSIAYYAPVVGSLSPLNQGTSGTIYLTYDDGLTYANQIMNYASCFGIKVTFFELGTRVGTDAVALRRAIAEGHAVQSHGFEHAMYDYGDRSYDWQFNDMQQSINAIMSVTGVRPTYFRPPGGNRSDNTYKAAAANGLNLILWGDSSRDSTVGGINSATTCANALAGAYPGATVLMHSTHQSTADALPCIAQGLAARGYNMQALR